MGAASVAVAAVIGETAVLKHFHRIGCLCRM